MASQKGFFKDVKTLQYMEKLKYLQYITVNHNLSMFTMSEFKVCFSTNKFFPPKIHLFEQQQINKVNKHIKHQLYNLTDIL